MNSSEDVLTRHWSKASEFPRDHQYHAFKYFSPRWRKTQVTFFSSCVNSDKIVTQQPSHENLNTKLIPPTIKTNGVEETDKKLNDAAATPPEQTERTSTDQKIDESFLAPPARELRGSSDSLNQDGGSSLGRFGRRKLNKLNRSLSAGVMKEKTHEHKKLTKSKSSDTECRRADNGIPVMLNFSPEFVRKTSLRTSLHDWLGNHKVHMPTKGSRKSKKSSNNGDPVCRDNDKQSERTGSDSSETWYPDGNSHNSSSKHVYRRFSAETMDVTSNALGRQCCSRRPSAPPSLNDTPEAHDLNCYRRKSVKVKTMTLPLNMQHAALVSCCNTDTKYANLLDFHLHCVMKEELRLRLGGVCFRADCCRNWCEEISENIKTRVQLLNSSPCKVICTVYIGALRDFGLHSATQALLDHKLDHHASACYQNKSLFAVASVFAIQYSCK